MFRIVDFKVGEDDGLYPSPRQERREQLDRQVATAFAILKGRSEALELTRDLQDQEESYNQKTVTASLSRQ